MSFETWTIHERMEKIVGKVDLMDIRLSNHNKQSVQFVVRLTTSKWGHPVIEIISRAKSGKKRVRRLQGVPMDSALLDQTIEYEKLKKKEKREKKLKKKEGVK
ncbi:MAG TPA: hypothetical protein PKH07_09620 [bacterium]|nr:hypothetical protein [bacterium]